MPTYTATELLYQFHQNQSVWIARLASGDIHPLPSEERLFRSGATLAMHPGHSGVMMLPFGGAWADIHTDHNRALAWLRQRQVHDALVWGMVPDSDIDLAMLAQGYRVGFEPRWMTRDLTAPIAMPTHEITLATDRDIDQLPTSEVPYIMRDQLESTRRLVSRGHREVAWLVARINDQVVGQAIVNIVGEHAGLFNVGVSGRHRRRGIGTSLSLAAMHIARERGATSMNLNSTGMGQPLYARAGFQYIGIGQTWVRTGTDVRSEPGPRLQQLIISLGTGDLAALVGENIPAHLPNGMTAQELAARFHQQDSLRYLIENGHVPEIMALWEAGFRDEAIAATADPRARELVTGSRGARPIHLAVEKGAGSLVLALIHAGADLHARDDEYRATPLDWAHACNKPTIARILQRAGSR
jgi:GNAT superfamily N-acetyltransferase